MLRQENAGLQEQLSQLQREAEEARAKLVELDLEVQQKTNRLAEVELRLKDSLAERAEEEERLSRRLRDSQETIASLKSQPQQIKVRSPFIRIGLGALQCLAGAPQVPPVSALSTSAQHRDFLNYLPLG